MNASENQQRKPVSNAVTPSIAFENQRAISNNHHNASLTFSKNYH